MIEELHTISEKQITELREALRETARDNAAGAFRLCELLHRTHCSRVDRGGKSVAPWQVWGYPTFHAFVEKEVGMHGGTAQVYRGVYQKFGIEWAGAWSKGDLLSITKMRCIARSPKIKKANVAMWLKRARLMSCCELEHELLGAATEHHFAMPVTAREKKVLDDAIETARELFDGTDRRGAVITRIVQEWLQAQRKRAA